MAKSVAYEALLLGVSPKLLRCLRPKDGNTLLVNEAMFEQQPPPKPVRDKTFQSRNAETCSRVPRAEELVPTYVGVYHGHVGRSVSRFSKTCNTFIGGKFHLFVVFK